MQSKSHVIYTHDGVYIDTVSVYIAVEINTTVVYIDCDLHTTCCTHHTYIAMVSQVSMEPAQLLVHGLQFINFSSSIAWCFLGRPLQYVL